MVKAIQPLENKSGWWLIGTDNNGTVMVPDALSADLADQAMRDGCGLALQTKDAERNGVAYREVTKLEVVAL